MNEQNKQRRSGGSITIKAKRKEMVSCLFSLSQPLMWVIIIRARHIISTVKDYFKIKNNLKSNNPDKSLTIQRFQLKKVNLEKKEKFETE